MLRICGLILLLTVIPSIQLFCGPLILMGADTGTAYSTSKTLEARGSVFRSYIDAATDKFRCAFNSSREWDGMNELGLSFSALFEYNNLSFEAGAKYYDFPRDEEYTYEIFTEIYHYNDNGFYCGISLRYDMDTYQEFYSLIEAGYVKDITEKSGIIAGGTLNYAGKAFTEADYEKGGFTTFLAFVGLDYYINEQIILSIILEHEETLNEEIVASPDAEFHILAGIMYVF